MVLPHREKGFLTGEIMLCKCVVEYCVLCNWCFSLCSCCSFNLPYSFFLPAADEEAINKYTHQSYFSAITTLNWIRNKKGVSFLVMGVVNDHGQGWNDFVVVRPRDGSSICVPPHRLSKWGYHNECRTMS